MAQRPGVDKGKDVPTKFTLKEISQDKEKTEQYANESKKWIQAGMKEDARK
jgi:glutathione S-transferase